MVFRTALTAAWKPALVLGEPLRPETAWAAPAQIRLKSRECSDRDRSEAFHLHRHGAEREGREWQLFESAKVLGDRNLRAQKRCVHRARSAGCVIDVHRIDSY